eukprot:1132671-Pelagomonas_calceolata.AAC.2
MSFSQKKSLKQAERYGQRLNSKGPHSRCQSKGTIHDGIVLSVIIAQRDAPLMNTIPNKQAYADPVSYADTSKIVAFQTSRTDCYPQLSKDDQQNTCLSQNLSQKGYEEMPLPVQVMDLFVGLWALMQPGRVGGKHFTYQQVRENMLVGSPLLSPCAKLCSARDVVCW